MCIDEAFGITLCQAHPLSSFTFRQLVFLAILLNFWDGDMVHARAKIKLVEIVKGTASPGQRRLLSR